MVRCHYCGGCPCLCVDRDERRGPLPNLFAASECDVNQYTYQNLSNAEEHMLARILVSVYGHVGGPQQHFNLGDIPMPTPRKSVKRMFEAVTWVDEKGTTIYLWRRRS
jgi:hypothetical protein